MKEDLGTAKEAVAEAIEHVFQKDRLRRARPGPKPNVPLDPMERHIKLCSQQLDHYESKLNAGIELDAKEEARMLKLIETIRKNETTRQQLLAKANVSKKSDPQLARDMVLAGVSKLDVLELYPDNPAVVEALSDL